MAKVSSVIEIKEFSHHGELLQGIFEGNDSKLHRGLITLKFNTYSSTAIFIKDSSMEKIRIFPENKVKSLKAAEITLSHIQKNKKCGGYLILKSNIPEEMGFGSSTSDVVASIKAIMIAFNTQLSPEKIAEIAVNAEGASDAIMFEECVLFAQREGKILENYHVLLPSFCIIGFNDSNGETVNTLDYEPANYNLDEINTFKILKGLFEYAIKTKDKELIGMISTTSAKINQKYLPKPHFNEILEIANLTKALGVQVAHSGTLVGLLFPDNIINQENKLEEVKSYLRKIGITDVWIFNTGR